MKREEIARRLHEELRDVRVSPALRTRTLNALRGKEHPVMKRKFSVALIAALVAVTLCAAALAAAGRWGMLDFVGRYGDAYIPQDAADYVQSDVATFEEGGVTVNVRELYYDGRTTRMTIDITPKSAKTLLCGVDTSMDGAWQELISLGEGDGSDTRAVLDVYHQNGYTRAYNVNIWTTDEETGTISNGSLDFVLGEDGTLTYYKQEQYDDDRPERQVTLKVGVTPYDDPEAGEQSLNYDKRIIAEQTLTLTSSAASPKPAADGVLADTYVSEEPMVYADAGVRVDRVLIEVKPQEIYATVDFTVIDEAAFALTDEGLWFEFIDPDKDGAYPVEQRLQGGMTSGGGIEPVTERHFVQKETLGKNELSDTYTLRGFNCWEKNRYETHTFTMRPATAADVLPLTGDTQTAGDK